MPDLFDHALQERMQSEAPLAARIRPRTLGKLKADFRDFAPYRMLRKNLGSLFIQSSLFRVLKILPIQPQLTNHRPHRAKFQILRAPAGQWGDLPIPWVVPNPM